MKTGFLGTFVLAWRQTSIDGARNAPLEGLVPGAGWTWDGDALRVDGPSGVLRLDLSREHRQMRRRAGRKLRRVLGHVLPAAGPVREDPDEDAPLAEHSFMLTDGRATYTGVVIAGDMDGQPPLVMFQDTLPPRRTALWVARCGTRVGPPDPTRPAGETICFAAGTLIRTPEGKRPVETLREGDSVLTRDAGAQPVLWIGRRDISGARLHVTPALRPIRIDAGLFGPGQPEPDLLVSPAHRLLLRGPAARDLFNTDEVLIRARDLAGRDGVAVAHAQTTVSYVHLMLGRHHVLWANGVETESFHPADMPVAALAPEDRARLAALFPALIEDPHLYGPHARRSLTRSEAVLFLHRAA